MGMPSSGFFTPRARSASAARAAARPRSKSRTQIALTLASCRSMRPMTSCANSTALTFLAASAADVSTAVLKLHCDLAKAYSRSVIQCGVDDAQFAALLQEQWLYSGATPLCYRLGEHGVRSLEPFFDLTRFLYANRCPLRLKTL